MRLAYAVPDFYYRCATPTEGFVMCDSTHRARKRVRLPASPLVCLARHVLPLLIADTSRSMCAKANGTPLRWNGYGKQPESRELWSGFPAQIPSRISGGAGSKDARFFCVTTTMTLDGWAARGPLKNSSASPVKSTRSEERRVGKECRSRWS